VPNAGCKLEGVPIDDRHHGPLAGSSRRGARIRAGLATRLCTIRAPDRKKRQDRVNANDNDSFSRLKEFQQTVEVDRIGRPAATAGGSIRPRGAGQRAGWNARRGCAAQSL
jgi:hypothetical protein